MANCDNCQDDASQCRYCKEGFIYDAAAKACKPCAAGCAECFLDATVTPAVEGCFNCQQGWAFQDPEAATGVCVKA